MKPSLPVVVFAPVDQTFLSGDTSRGYDSADDVLAGEAVILILCSSMTRAELERCQQELGFVQPFICESGAAVLLPHGYFPFDVPSDRDLTGYHVIEFGRPYGEVVALLHRTASRLGIDVVGFSDMSIEEVASECCLSLSHARLAKLRDYDEPFRILETAPDARARLWKALRAVRLDCTCRGHYEHVGAAVNASIGVGVLKSLYRRTLGRFVTVDLASAGGNGALHTVTLPVDMGKPTGAVGMPSMRRIPGSDITIDRASWIETILEAARRGRERRQPAGLLR